MNLFKATILSQSTYSLVTAVWPLVHINSFMEVTGPKTDIWLVKTVGALLIPVAIAMIMSVFVRTDKRPVMALRMLTAVAFMCIDFYYSASDVISDVYMIDGVVQILFLLAWAYVTIRYWPIIVNNHQK